MKRTAGATGKAGMVVAIVVAMLSGSLCSAGENEDKVKVAFAAFQTALKTKDADAIWDLLDSRSQAAAEAAAKTVKASYDKAKADKKKELEKAFGLRAEELSNFSGKLYVKSARYHGKYHEVPDSKIEKIAVEGDKATVFYIEADNDKVKLGSVLEGGKWKMSAVP